MFGIQLLGLTLALGGVILFGYTSINIARVEDIHSGNIFVDVIVYATQYFISAALLIAGRNVYRVGSNNEKGKTRERDGSLLATALILLLLSYTVHALIHFNNGWVAGCNEHSILLTLFPVRQVYLAPTVEHEWNNGTIQTIAEAGGGTEAFGAVLSEGYKEGIMDVARYGSCEDIVIMARGEKALQERKRRRFANLPPQSTR